VAVFRQKGFPFSFVHVGNLRDMTKRGIIHDMSE